MMILEFGANLEFTPPIDEPAFVLDPTSDAVVGFL